MGDEESLQKNLKLANQELRSRLKSYKEKEAQIRETLRDYGLEKRLEYIPDSLLYPIDVTDSNSMLSTQYRKLENTSNSFTIAQLETFLSAFQNIHNSANKYCDMFRRELEKYKKQYVKECESATHDLLDFTSLQTSIHKLQSDIHQANELQEQKAAIISKLFECHNIHEKISGYLKEAEILRKRMHDFRHLPPNLLEAEKKLEALKERYKDICDQFTKIIKS